MKKKEFGLGTLLLGVVSYGCFLGMKAIDRKLERKKRQEQQKEEQREEKKSQ